MQRESSFPAYSRGERLVDLWIHCAGVAAGPIAFLVLLVAAAPHGDVFLMVGVTLYGSGLVAMLVCSALYNLAAPSPRKTLFRRFDHAAIFLMIAGTYSPFTLHGIGGTWGGGLFVFVWLVAAGGIAMELLHPEPDRLEAFEIALYLLLGWTILVALGPLVSAVSAPAVLLLVAGGLLYTVGVLFHLWDRLPYHNAVWHALVLAAAACHYAAVLQGVVLGAC